MRRLLAAAVCLPLIAACQKPETPEQEEDRIMAQSESVMTVVRDFYETHRRWFNGGHAESLATHYAPAAYVKAPHAPPAQGREGTRQMWTGAFANGPVGELQLRVEHVVANGPLASARFTWTFAPSAASPIQQPDTGAGLAVLYRTNGQWLIVEEIWNSNLPMERLMPAPARGARR